MAPPPAPPGSIARRPQGECRPGPSAGSTTPVPDDALKAFLEARLPRSPLARAGRERSTGRTDHKQGPVPGGRPCADVSVVVVRAGPEPELLRLGRVLVFLGLTLRLRLRVFERAVIEQLADRRDGIRRDLDQIEITLACHLQRLRDRDDTELRPIFVDEPNFRNPDGTVGAGPGRRAWRHVAGLDVGAPP